MGDASEKRKTGFIECLCPERDRFLSSPSTDQLRSGARLLGTAGGSIALIGLGGYAARQPIFFQLHPGLQGMSPLTAMGLGGVAVAILASSWHREILLWLAAATAAALAVATLGCHAVSDADTLSPIVGAGLFNVPADEVGRTSIASAVGLLLLAGAAVLHRKRPFAADVASGLALVLAGTALLGYFYNIEDLYALPMFNSMGLNTAVALALLAMAELLIEPGSGWVGVIVSREAGGGATRRQLSFIMLPVIAGWLLLRATRAAQIGPGAAMALLVVVTVVPLAMLILRDGWVLNALSRARTEKEEIQARFTADVETKLAEQARALENESAKRIMAEAAIYRAQRMEAVGQLTGGIAHDFNNLLMAVRGNLELMQRRLAPAEDRLHRYLENAIMATDKGAKVTAQLLAFSSSQKLQVCAFEIDPVLYNARALIGGSLGPTIDVVLELDTSGVWAMTDAVQLELAILNLAVNARDAMPDGGTLRIQSGTCLTRLNGDAHDAPYVAVRIVDDGVGMSQEIVAHAIEPFFTTKARDKGTGLGLAQVYGFVRQCGGDLRIVSAPGAGTSVEILLPGAEARLQSDEEASTDRAAHLRLVGSNRQMLVVDDDDVVRSVIVDALGAVGFQVLEASSGEAGLALLNGSDPVAAVIDFLMPGMNGAEVAKHAQQRRPGLPIVFVSGYSETVALDGIAGAVVLRKPFDIGALDRAITSVLH